MDNNEHCTKQLSLNFGAVKGHKSQAFIIDFNAAREKKENSKKVKAISAILEEAEKLTW